MFHALTRIAFALIAVAAAAPQSSAQAPEWNRSIKDIRIVHPPGTPPGTWRALVSFGQMAQPTAPAPTDLSFEAVLTLDGMPFALITPDVTSPMSEIACFPTASCPQNNCRVWYIVAPGIAVTNNAFCFDPPSYTWGCNCWTDWDTFPWQVDFVAPGGGVGGGTVVGVTITARAGSLPELYTADDSMSVTVHDQVPGVDFCFGDGTGTACPCGNSGSPGNGCANSVNPAGAYLATSGTASVSSDSLVLSGSGMPNGPCLYFQGTTMLAGTAFGDGLRCAGGSVVRLDIASNDAAGTSSYPGAGDPSVSVKGMVPAAGGLRTYQIWYRNAGTYCTPSTFNLTNGSAVTWAP